MTSATWFALTLIFLGLLVVVPKREAADMEVQFNPRMRRRRWDALFQRS